MPSWLASKPVGGSLTSVAGPGQVGRYLADREARVFGVDLAIPMVRMAASRFGLCAVCGDMQRAPSRVGILLRRRRLLLDPALAEG